MACFLFLSPFPFLFLFPFPVVPVGLVLLCWLNMITAFAGRSLRSAEAQPRPLRSFGEQEVVVRCRCCHAELLQYEPVSIQLHV